MTAPKLRIVPDAPAGVTPLLRWAGGKRWFVKEFGDDLFARVIELGGTYFEPFLGGGAMALHLGLPDMVLGDAEEELMITYGIVARHPEEVITLLGWLVEQGGTGREGYNKVRSLNEGLSPLEIATRLIYLNRLCFNGVYRKNKRGEFNVPWGKVDKEMPSPERIREVSIALKGAELRAGDFEAVISLAGANDLIYADPPYHQTYAGYTPRGFTDKDQERLAEALYNAHQRGAEFYAHNADTEKVRYWYGEWAEIIPTQERRNVNSDGKGREPVQCVLIAGSAKN
jgi:DNA adenine methylase